MQQKEALLRRLDGKFRTLSFPRSSKTSRLPLFPCRQRSTQIELRFSPPAFAAVRWWHFPKGPYAYFSRNCLACFRARSSVKEPWIIYHGMYCHIQVSVPASQSTARSRARSASETTTARPGSSASATEAPGRRPARRTLPERRPWVSQLGRGYSTPADWLAGRMER